MAVNFKLGKHTLRDATIVEILIDGNTVGVIYPEGDKGIKLISAHMEGIREDDGVRPSLPLFPPSVVIVFNPIPYSIVDNQIVKWDKQES